MANMNNINKLNKIKSAVANKKAKVICMEQLADQTTNEVLEKVYDGSIGLAQLLNITDKCIDMNKCEKPIQVMQKIYSAGSEVGPTTVKGQNAYMIDVTTDEGFEAFKDALVMLKEQDKHVPYKTVWKENYNVFTFDFVNGKHYTFYVVTNEEIKMLADSIKAMSKSEMTKEEAMTLQADLPPFIRAFQESSIDVSKDKDKVFVLNGKTITIKAFLNTVGVYSHLTKTYKDSIDFGFNTVKEAKHAGKIIPAFKCTNDARDAEKPVMDLMGHATKALEETAEEKLNGTIHKLYSVADNSLFAPFINDVQISKELAYFIKSIYRICYASITEGSKITDERYAVMRNAIYSRALTLGVDKEDVIRVAIATAMTSVRREVNETKDDVVIITKDADVNKFKQFPVANIFPDEFVEVITDMPIYETIHANNKEIIKMDRDIEDNETIEFVDGVSVDGTIELNRKITGELTELDGELIFIKDTTQFDFVDALLITDTFKETTDKESLAFFSKHRDNRQTCDHGEYLNSIQHDLQAIKIAGRKGGIVVGNSHFLGLMTQSGEIPTGTIANVTDIISYETNNGEQQLFLLVVNPQ